MKFSLEIIKDKCKGNGNARLGILHTAHGDIHTPCFMAVGTTAAMKAMHFDQLIDSGTEIMLCNTYHLMIQERYLTIEKLGGLHEFMNWQKPILTDCGGFQAMSLSSLNKITENAVTFRCHLSGKKYELTPELSVDIQRRLDADISMALDECVRQPAGYHYTKKAMERSLRWAKRSKDAFISRDGYALYGIVQGGADKELRTQSINGLLDIGFDGYAIGGDLAVDNGWELMFNTFDYLTPMMDWEKPRYVMGVGKPIDIVGSVLRGIDQFDCVLPCRNARNGQAFTRNGVLNIKNSKYKYDKSKIDDSCKCRACSQHTRAYINHLFKANETLGAMLLTEHNITYFQDLMKDIREAIKNEKMEEFAREYIEKFGKTNVDNK
ncbi:MAG: tRNA guanosine(34) transglycosylase Tgt [Rickettsiales bacterium]|jgi:queuine tRNA-ribosyltransferase|nr:tRNA guanosine(34) transglycosylase Tgt [Rickettsiales bacterium]